MGGVESVRPSLCKAALQQVSFNDTSSSAHQKQQQQQPPLLQQQQQAPHHHALAAIRITYPSKGAPRVNYVRRIVNHLMLLEQSVATFSNDSATPTADKQMVHMAHLVAEIRVMDALLRISRDCSRHVLD